MAKIAQIVRKAHKLCHKFDAFSPNLSNFFHYFLKSFDI